MDLLGLFSKSNKKPDRPPPGVRRGPGRPGVDAAGEGVNRAGPPLRPGLYTDVKGARRVNSPPSSPSIPRSGKSSYTSIAQTDHERKVLRPNGSGEHGAPANKRGSSWKSVSATAKMILRTVKESSDAFPPLKSVAGGLCMILDNHEQTTANKEAIESLAHRIKTVAESLCAPIHEGDAQEQSRRNALRRKLEDVCQRLVPLMMGQEGITGFLTNTENAGKISDLVDDIREAVMDYQTSLQRDTYNNSYRLIESADRALLNAMYHTPSADYKCGNRQGCLRGTRKDVLEEIESWLAVEREQQVFWLNGLAGTGKSTIAQTFAEKAFADEKLGASFFCSRDFEDRSNLQAIFPTLAFQLAHRYPPFRKELLQVLTASHDLGQQTLCSQMEKLLVGPLRATGISTLIIIDALDECRDDEPASALLSILSRYASKIPKVKFFITGRPEPRMRSGFRLESLVMITEVFKLHEVKPEVVDRDIELFFRKRLSEVAKNQSYCDLTEDWPSSSDIEILCRKANGFFIYASTAVKFIASEDDVPSDRLAQITSLPQSTTEEGKSGADQLYIAVLEQAFHDSRPDNSQRFSRFRSVVGTILLVFNPLSTKGLSELLGLHLKHIHTALRSLHSLLLVPDNAEDPIVTFHKSFPDFLTDPKRCEDERFLVEPATHHAEILLSCLNLMKGKLKKNICKLDYHAVLSEVEDLPALRKAHIGDTLEYACCFWTKHLLEIPGDSPRVKELQKEIDDFFTTRLPFWIEVLALTENLDAGVYAMNEVDRWYGSTGVPCKWTTDSQRLVLESFDAICDSPSFTYHSAIPFSPSSSWLHRSYAAERSGEVKVVTGLPDEWGKCSRTVELDDSPLALACWKDTVAVGLESGGIILLDAITGTQTATLSGHTDSVRSITFSSDGASLVSGGDDRTIKIWDIQTGGVVKTFSGHTDFVHSVSISSNRGTIASGSRDRTIRLWDAWTGECYCVTHQDESVDGVNLSPTNSDRFISVSGYKSQQWDTDGNQIGPSYDGSHVAFSPDGTRFVSCQGGVVAIRNTDSGAIMGQLLQDGGSLKYCCFSPDGKSVAAVVDHTIYVWDATSLGSHYIESFLSHTSGVTSLAFSSFLVSASYNDRSVKIWRTRPPSRKPVANNRMSTPLDSPSVTSVTLRAEDGIAISTHSDGVVKVWNTSTGLCTAEFQTPAKGPSRGDAQMVDNVLVCVWWADQRIHVWDVERDELFETVDAPGQGVKAVRVSGDGSMVFCLDSSVIRAWSISTGELVAEVESGVLQLVKGLTVDESSVWVCMPRLGQWGWDFGIDGSSPVPLSDVPLSRPHLDSTGRSKKQSASIKDVTTEEEILQLYGRYEAPVDASWDGRYLAAGYESGEVLILDFVHVPPRIDL